MKVFVHSKGEGLKWVDIEELTDQFYTNSYSALKKKVKEGIDNYLLNFFAKKWVKWAEIYLIISILEVNLINLICNLI